MRVARPHAVARPRACATARQSLRSFDALYALRFAAFAPAAALALALTSCGGSSSGGADRLAAGSQPSSIPPASSAPAAGGCTAPSTAKPQVQTFHSEPPLTIDRTTYTATVKTNCGTIVIALDGKHAPHTVNSFAFLAGKHYFDNTI